MGAFEDLIAANPHMLAKNNKYAAKLSFQDRCAVLAAYKGGVLKMILAEAFGINVSTVEYICSPSSNHYRNVRRERADLGPERFHSTYLTDEQVQRIAKAKDALEKRDEVETHDQYEARIAAERVKAHGPDKRAAGLAGRHVVLVPMTGTLMVEVVFVKPEPFVGMEENRAEGWYIYVDPSSPGYDPENFHGHYGYETDANTSKSAWRAFLSATQAEVKS